MIYAHTQKFANWQIFISCGLINFIILFCITWNSFLTVLFTLLKHTVKMTLYECIWVPCSKFFWHFLTSITFYPTKGIQNVYFPYLPTYLPTQYKHIWVCNGKPMIFFLLKSKLRLKSEILLKFEKSQKNAFLEKNLAQILTQLEKKLKLPPLQT
jgi:hypothetical protein